MADNIANQGISPQGYNYETGPQETNGTNGKDIYSPETGPQVTNDANGENIYSPTLFASVKDVITGQEGVHKTETDKYIKGGFCYD